MVLLLVILFSSKCFLFVYMYIDLLKLKAYKLFENSDADLSWLLFKRSQLVVSNFRHSFMRTRSYAFRKGLPFYRYITKYRCLIQRVLRNYTKCNEI